MPEDQEDSTQDVCEEHQEATMLKVMLKDPQQDLKIAESVNSEDCEDLDGSIS